MGAPWSQDSKGLIGLRWVCAGLPSSSGHVADLWAPLEAKVPSLCPSPTGRGQTSPEGLESSHRTRGPSACRPCPLEDKAPLPPLWMGGGWGE